MTRPKYGLTVTVPDAPDPALVYRIIYEELVARKITEKSWTAYREVIARLSDAGVKAIILGYTKIMLLGRPEDNTAPIFDTTEIHDQAAVTIFLKK
ncbi:hypothetical protein [Acetobacter indonesiensis]|uniref:hypothetical protein n=1 Tax=Acetobacter indonesiensis TaxID=104101 RepID=UPI0039EACD8D